MKKIIPFLLLSAVFAACGGPDDRSVEELIEGGNLSKIRQKKSELSQEQSELTRQISKLDEAIERLDENQNRPLVDVELVQDTIFRHFSEVQGNIATDQNIIIYPETSGILTNVRASEGQQVSNGQVLAVIDDGGLASELARMETLLALAKTTFERQKRLWDQKIGSEMQFLEAKSNFESSQNAVNQIKSQLAKSTIRAPFSGVVDEVLTEQGEVVVPGQSQLFRLVSLQNMYVEANVPENYLSQVRQGTEVVVEIGSIGKEYTGEIKRIGNTINPNNRTFRIEVAIPNKEGMLRPNQIATVKINDYTSEAAIVVAERAVQQNAQGENLVYIFEPQGENIGVARKAVVETGYVTRGQIEITSGLEPGSQIITEGSRSLQDGQEVKTSN